MAAVGQAAAVHQRNGSFHLPSPNLDQLAEPWRMALLRTPLNRRESQVACNPAVELVQLAVGTRQRQAIMSKSNSDTIRLAYVFILLLKVKKKILAMLVTVCMLVLAKFVWKFQYTTKLPIFWNFMNLASSLSAEVVNARRTIPRTKRSGRSWKFQHYFSAHDVLIIPNVSIKIQVLLAY